ncbi:MAG TPA: glycosyltransferase family 1 protein [Vicinamibacterales bacterium]|jgi:glycosyltransferase involved in cell wall biosynthesis
MRIGIDAREIGGRVTGVGRYLGGLIREWTGSPAAKRHEFVLYAPGDLALAVDTRHFATRRIKGAGGTFWEQVQLPQAIARDHLDIWFSPAYSMPLRLRIPAVVAIHDLSFVAHPEWFRVREGARRRLLSRHSAEKARAVITISEFSRGELIERLGVPAGKIHVIPPGVDRPAKMTSQRGANRVLFVGSIFNRRHVPDLVRAFAPIARRRDDAALDIVGDNRSHPRENIRRVIAAEQLERRVRWHQYVSDAHLQELYSTARAFAFLSEYEGLGLPPLEAMAAGIPPVLIDTAVARESCGDAALYVPAADIPATTRALETALTDETVRGRILAAAPHALAQYSWPGAAARTLSVLEGVA